jgi:ubiquinone/menaquinone biosynthesis C-methylase UbiE
MSAERQQSQHDPWWGEHVHRYNEVLPYINKDDIILDLACGTGFGSDILAKKTNGKVIGGDISREAIDECSATWKAANLSFMVLDGTRLPFENNYFDRIVSFETIEHTTEYMAMLKEFYRVLKPGGIAFISTPNFPVNSPGGEVVNPYHTQEFTYDQLSGVLSQVFQDVSIAGQKYSRYESGKVPRIGKLIERAFNKIIGVRKLPYAVKNGVYKTFTGESFYPKAEHFTLTTDPQELLKCKTFFCTCRKYPD